MISDDEEEGCFVGLDVNTTCCGYCVLGENGKIKDFGVVEKNEGEENVDFARRVVFQVQSVCHGRAIKRISLEDYASGYQMGRTSGKVMADLGNMNGLVEMACTNLLVVRPQKGNVLHARAQLGIRKKGGKKAALKYVMDIAAEEGVEFPALAERKKCDVADAYVMSRMAYSGED